MDAKPTAPEPRGGSGGGSGGLATKDIWLLLSSLEPAAASAKPATNNAGDTRAAVEERDTFTLLLGAKSAGKTSLCNAYIHRGDDKAGGAAGDDVKPTTGLEYLFVRQNGAVAHIWELAATRCVPELMRVPLAPERIVQGACVIAVDLSNPGDALPLAVKWLTTLHRIVADVLKAKEKNPVDKAAVERLKKQALARYGNDHEDRDDVSPIAVPVLLLGTKYDVFAKEDSARRKPLQQALRFFAHLFGATLLFTSVKEKPLVTQMRAVLKAHVFGTSANLRGLKKEVDAVAKPLFVPVGSDRFDNIGLPDGARKEDLLGTPASDVDAKARPWKKFVAKVFEPTGAVGDGWDDGAAADAQSLAAANPFPEPNVDRARQRKFEELARYREAARKKGDKAKVLAIKA